MQAKTATPGPPFYQEGAGGVSFPAHTLCDHNNPFIVSNQLSRNP